MIILIVISALSLWGVAYCEVESPQISHSSGFYEEPFELVMSASLGSEIYYTLDGSVPNRNSFRYTGPVQISNRSLEQNVHSMRTDVSTGFYKDLLYEFKTLDEDPLYQEPDYLLDKCTIIRAISVNRAGMISDEVSMTYFVGIPPESYDGCKIVSLVTEPDNLFSEDKGIYVTGDKFEQYLENGEVGEHWRFWDANYRQRGADWEREAIFHFFDADGRLFLSKVGGIRVHGGVSRGTLPRSLNLYARAEYDHSDVFEGDLFDSGVYPHAVTLNSGGNQLITQINDYMMTQKVRERNYTTLLFEPYVLFLNGEYWGFYWMSEKYDESYLNFYYGVDEDNCIIIKNSTVEAGPEGGLQLYNIMKEFISQNDMAEEKNYAKACEMIDIDSFLDYYATMIYIARAEDWPHGNWAAWRSRTYGSSAYADTKWRWMLFDCNSTCMNTYPGFDMTAYNTLEEIAASDPLFSSLWRNESFRKDFQDRIFEIADQCFDAEEMDRFIREYTENMEPALRKSWARFYGSQNNKYEEYIQTLDSIRHFFLNRRAYVETWFPEEN